MAPVGSLGASAGSAECEINPSQINEAAPQPDLRTLRTPVFMSRAKAMEDGEYLNSCKDSERPVLPVLIPSKTPSLPFFCTDGTLSIPFDSPGRYHWWKLGGGRLTVAQITSELRVRQAQGTSPLVGGKGVE